MRVILSGLFVLVFITESAAQNRVQWRPGSILRGLGNTVQGVAREIGGRPAAPVDGSDDNIIADEVHQERDRSRFPATARHVQPAVPPAQQSSRAVSIDDVIKMVHLGLSESTIVQYISQNGAKQPLNVSDLIRLHEAGVSEPVISALQSARIFTTHPTPASPPRRGHVRSEPRVSAPSRGVDEDRFGPSILRLRQPLDAFDSSEITPPSDL